LPGAALDLLKIKPEIEEAIRKNIRKAALLPLALPAVYVADVWILGSASAILYDQAENIKNIFTNYSYGDTNTVSWYFKHPFEASWAWLTRPSGELSVPAVREIWLVINGLLIGAGTALHIKNKLLQLKNQKNDANHVHGLKVINNPAYGTSRWASIQDLSKFCEFGPPTRKDAAFPGGNLIGELDGKIIRVNFEKMPKNTPKTAPHAIIYGGTGSGKTFSLVIGNIIAAVCEGQSIVAIDPKGELFKTTAKWLKEEGYENVWALNFMTPEHSNRWNQVIECQDDAEISEMVDTLSKNATTVSDSYFMLKAMELAEAMVGMLKGDFPVEQQHMRSLMALTAWPEEVLDARFKAAYKAGKISPMIYERWRGVVKKNYEYAVSNLTAVLKNMTTAPLAALMSQQEIDLTQIGKKKTALFLIVPTGGEGVYLKPILSVFYKFLFKRLDKLAFQSPGQVLPVKVRNIWDEMANVGMIPGLPEIISTARSKGIHLQMILQTPTQLEYVYGVNEAKTILGNCPTVMLAGIAPADKELARMFSENLGDAAVEMERTSEDLTVPMKNYFTFKKKQRMVMKRPLMTMDEILRIDPRHAIALLQWSYPVYVKKVGWVDLPQARNIVKCGMMSVEEYLPARSFDVDVPVINEDDKTRTPELTRTNTNKVTDRPVKIWSVK